MKKCCYLVSERKLGIFSKIKEGENYNHRNTFKYFEDYNLSLTQRLGKITVFGRALFTVIALLFGCAAFFSCSNNKEAESEKGPIETFTDKTAKHVAGRILAPIEKARSVKDQQEDRFSDMEESLKEQ